jgi:hypothetical protein
MIAYGSKTNICRRANRSEAPGLENTTICQAPLIEELPSASEG